MNHRLVLLLLVTALGGCADNMPEANTTDTTDGDEETTTDEVAYSIAPPAWLRGHWTGASSSGVGKTAIINTDDISFGDLDASGAQVDVTSFAMFPTIDPAATFLVHEESDTTYSYTIEFTGPEGPVAFTDTFTLMSEDSVLYNFELGGESVDSFEMHAAPASAFITPPAWLDGRWEGAASDGVERVALVTSTNISFGELVDGQDQLTDFGMILDFDPAATFRVLTPIAEQDDTFAYEIHVFNPEQDGIVSFVDTFVSTGPDTLEYTFTLDGAPVDSFEMKKGMN